MNIIPSLITGIARDEDAGSNFSETHTPPSFATFSLVSWVRVEYRLLPQSPPTVGHSLPAGPLPLLSDCTATVAGNAKTPTNAATPIHCCWRLIAPLLSASAWPRHFALRALI